MIYGTKTSNQLRDNIARAVTPFRAHKYSVLYQQSSLYVFIHPFCSAVRLLKQSVLRLLMTWHSGLLGHLWTHWWPSAVRISWSTPVGVINGRRIFGWVAVTWLEPLVPVVTPHSNFWRSHVKNFYLYLMPIYFHPVLSYISMHFIFIPVWLCFFLYSSSIKWRNKENQLNVYSCHIVPHSFMTWNTLCIIPALCNRNPLANNGFPSQRANNAELWICCCWWWFWFWSEEAVEQYVELPVNTE